MKKLIYIPMLHPPEALRGIVDDIGPLASETSASISQRRSREFWEIVKDKLTTLDIATPLRFYIEGYVGESINVTPGTTETPNGIQHPDQQIIVDFLKRVGGTVEKTEDHQLLEDVFDIYRKAGEATEKLQKSMLTSEEDNNDTELVALIRTVMDSGKRLEELDEKRDNGITQTIINSLKDGETGILFLGERHKVTSKLPSDIQVEILDPRLKEILRELDETLEAQTEVHRQSPEGNF